MSSIFVPSGAPSPRPPLLPNAPSALERGGAADPTTAAGWRSRLDALIRWCLAEVPLAPAAAAAAGALRPTLGDLLRRALGHAGDGVVDLLDALDAPGDPAARARLARVLGADVLLVVVTARGGVIVRADARACRTRDEAEALVSAFLGHVAPPWAAGGGVHVRGPDIAPLLAHALGGGAPPPGTAFDARPAVSVGDAGDSTLVLPFLPLDGSAPPAPPRAGPFGVPAAPGDTLPVAPNAPPNELPNELPNEPPDDLPHAGAPLVFGGVLRPGAAFLDAPDRGDERARVSQDDAPHPAGAAPARDDDADIDDDEDVADALAAGDAFARAFACDAPRGGQGAAVLFPGDADDADAVPPAVPDPGAALARLRARTAPVERVPVVIATDDGEAEHLGDAATWLAEASEQELRALARGGWTGDTAVELALASDDPEIDDVARQARRQDVELVVEIDGDAAAAWLRRHRPETAERLAAVL